MGGATVGATTVGAAVGREVLVEVGNIGAVFAGTDVAVGNGVMVGASVALEIGVSVGATVGLFVAGSFGWVVGVAVGSGVWVSVTVNSIVAAASTIISVAVSATGSSSTVDTRSAISSVVASLGEVSSAETIVKKQQPRKSGTKIIAAFPKRLVVLNWVLHQLPKREMADMLSFNHQAQ